MKTSSILLALAATVSPAVAYWRGFNVQATNIAGQCKSAQDWTNDFNKVRSLGFDSIRVYASSDCNTLPNAVPAAIATGVKILVGVWTQDANHFSAEKQALLSAVQQHGFGWIAAVSVGSEDLYRKETAPGTLAGQIYDVRGMLSVQPGFSSAVRVGHVDTWTVWVDGANAAVIKACDFIGVDGYPYFESTVGNSIDNAKDLFWASIDAVKSVVAGQGSGAWIWVAETGWPSTGPTINQAQPSLKNAQTYWSQVACSAFQSLDTFWYTLEDYYDATNFGVLDINGNPKFNLAC